LELEPLIGFFINILALRIRLADELTGEELLAQVRQVVFDGLSHQALPFEQLLAEMPELRQQGGRPLLPVMLRHQNFPEADVQHWAGGLEARVLSGTAKEVSYAKCDLDLRYHGDGSGLSVVAEFDTDCFDAKRVESLLLEMEHLLAQLVEMPHAPLSRLIEPSVEEQRSLERWNDTARSFEQISVIELFARQVATQPNGLACYEGEDVLSFGELDRRSDNLARVLLEHGVEVGTRVALYLPRGVEFLTCLLAVFKVRGVYVPVDPSYPASYVWRILENAQPSVVLTRSKSEVGSVAVPGAVVLQLDEALFEQDGGPLRERAAAAPGDVAYIAYTSGSTGQPNGVCVEHRQLVNCLQSLWEQKWWRRRHHRSSWCRSRRCWPAYWWGCRRSSSPTFWLRTLQLLQPHCSGTGSLV
jgi:non-ribosomal peptide synthetase component F